MRLRLTLAVCACACAAAAVYAAAAGAATHRDWLIVRCRPDNLPSIAHTTGYLRQMFTGAGTGTGNMTDYWTDMSLGQISTTGSVVATRGADRNGWYEENASEDTVSAWPRGQQVVECAALAAAHYNLADFYGVISLYAGLDTGLALSISATQNTLTVTLPTGAPQYVMGDVPTPPFGMDIDGSTQEIVEVTKVRGNVFTVTRGAHVVSNGSGGYAGATPESAPAGTEIQTLNTNSYGAASIGQAEVTINSPSGQGSGTYALALVNLPLDVNPTGAAHEMGHGFGLEHSRQLTTPTAGYFDPFDVMSAFADTFSATDPFSSRNVRYGGKNLFCCGASKGPGLDAAQIGNLGWMPSDRVYNFGEHRQTTIALHSLTDAKALHDSLAPGASTHSGTLEATAAANASFPFSATSTCTDPNYTLEYRESTGWWDSGIPTPAQYWSPTSSALNGEPAAASFPRGSVILDITCEEPPAPGASNYDYDWIVNTAPNHSATLGHNPHLYGAAAETQGMFWPGDEYADPDSHLYFAVNRDLTSPRVAVLTLSGRPLRTRVEVTATSAFLDSDVQLTATVRAKPTGGAYEADAAVPGHMLTLRLGSQSCSAETGLDGVASCVVTARGFGLERLTASGPATTAYAAISSSTKVEVLPERSVPIRFTAPPGIKFRTPPPHRPAPGPGS